MKEGYKKLISNLKFPISDHSGVTLLELMVAVALFGLTIVAASNIFLQVVNSQREAIISQEMQENMRYSLERTGKEIRTAQRDFSHSCISSGRVYWTNGTSLKFLNYHNNCVCYFLNSGRLYVSDSTCSVAGGLPLTPQKIVISNLNFKTVDSWSNQQAAVTMKMHVNVTTPGKNNSILDIQTTLSSRFYE
jgi:prepilin-type N-terminal cleavage/methylation domain-containing protein